MQKSRRSRVRAKISGTLERPRLSIFRSLKGTYAQIIDDVGMKTLVSASNKDVKGKMKKTEAAEKIGEVLADKAMKKGITKVVFDRSHYRFHGRVKALADAARKKGLQF